MKPQPQTNRMETRWWPLMLCMICSAVVAIGLWEGLIDDPAYAQRVVPFEGPVPTIKESVEAQKETNQKLDQLISFLKEGPVKVTVVEPPKPAKEPSRRR